MSLVPPPRTALDPAALGGVTADRGETLAGRRDLDQQQQRIQAHRAARVVAGRSADARECAELLAMLGLTAGDDERADR